MVAFARVLVDGRGASRIARVTAVFTFVAHLVDGRRRQVHRGFDPGALAPLLRLPEGPAVLLCALLKAAGETARLERTREMAFVRVAVSLPDVALLPPHVELLDDGRRLELPLDPRDTRTPVGFLPRSVRSALRRRRSSLPRAV